MSWAGRLRQVAELKERGDVDPKLAPPQEPYEGVVELLAAIDALPDGEHVELMLPGGERLAALGARWADVRPMFDRWLKWELLAAAPPPEAERFERQLRQHARGQDAPVGDARTGRFRTPGSERQSARSRRASQEGGLDSPANRV